MITKSRQYVAYKYVCALTMIPKKPSLSRSTSFIETAQQEHHVWHLHSQLRHRSHVQRAKLSNSSHPQCRRQSNKLPISNVALELSTLGGLTRKEKSMKNLTRMSKLFVFMMKHIHFHHNYAKGQSNSFQRDRPKEKKNKHLRSFSMCFKTYSPMPKPH